MKQGLFIISGAASGIGLDLAKTLESQGRELLLMDLDSGSLKKQFSESNSLEFVIGDVSRIEFWEEAVMKKINRRRVACLVNSAGVIRPGFVRDFSLKDIDFHLDVNTKGSILGTRFIANLMKDQGFGHVINISSLAGLAPVSGLSLYSASKFAIRGFSLAAATEYRKFGVNISVVCPDLVKTPMLDLQLDYPEEAKLTFSGPEKVLTPTDITKVLLKLMEKPKDLVCIPESRGLLAKVAGIWPGLGEIFRNSLESKGEKAIKKLR
ncbi:SDR family NAD(P)-dependent oxidoreductase [Algoriphagus sediminis]|uniref:SDR family oxidoreductase n=1 Tax=Algoriphagus sediminis TaxID=3057113 RepID=A0ABT7YG26_9BACT|nr:SDR family oxidoreductase [Algoriphagus sediminis]MDN3205290.1 SDR family oxidoreductase [Algoriphagus sediminis]